MKLTSRLTVRVRLALGFGAVGAMLAVVSAIGAWSSLHTRSMLHTEQEPAQRRYQMALEVRDASSRFDVAIRNIGLMTDPSAMQAQEARVTEADAAIRKTLAALLADDADAVTREALEKVQAFQAASAPLIRQAVAFGLAYEPEAAAKVIVDKLDPLSEQRRAVVQALAAQQFARSQRAGEQIAATSETAARLELVAGVAGLLCAALCSLLTSRAVTRPLAQAVQVAESVAAGDLTASVPAGSRDEFGQLMQALQTMTSNLRAVIGQVHQSTDALLSASTQIAAGNHDLSARTEQQASALQQTNASMSELTGSVRHNAESSAQANRLAEQSSAIADAGGQKVASVVATMQTITERSRKIGDIVGVIDGIAFQTNILALNAAVEAARAGESGRGFAVVAGEVRTLAQRSAEAAREIKTLIAASVQQVDTGSELAHDAGRTIGDVVESVRRVAHLIADISQSTAEQAGGVAQVGQAVSQLDQTTQQNAALVEQSAAAAESLKAQAQALREAVDRFRLAA